MQVAHKRTDLEERTLQFAKDVRAFVKRLQRTVSNLEDAKQVVRSSGSVGANYIEAQEALSKKDFAVRIRICRKEAKESVFWLRLVEPYEQDWSERQRLEQEATELLKIFSAIILKL